MRARVACCVVLTIGLGSVGHAQDTSSARVTGLIAYLENPASRFTARSALARIAEAENDTAPDSPDRGRLERFRSIIAGKADKHDEAIKSGLDALRIDTAHTFLSPIDRARLHATVARQAAAVPDWALAIPQFEQAIGIMQADPAADRAELLGLQAQLATGLHATGRSAEARKLNQTVLAGGTMIYGPESATLAGVLTNLVQDSYVLHDLAAMRGYLERLLAIGLKTTDAGAIDTALFQLGVLDYEMGHADDARAHMQRRLDLATASGDADRIGRAKRDLDVLNAKLAAR